MYTRSVDTSEDTTTLDEPIGSDVYAVALERMHEPSTETLEGSRLFAAFAVAIGVSVLAGALTLAGWYALHG